MSDAVAGPVSGPCVVDASTALKWVLQEEGSEAAVTLLDGRVRTKAAKSFRTLAALVTNNTARAPQGQPMAAKAQS